MKFFIQALGFVATLSAVTADPSIALRGVPHEGAPMEGTPEAERDLQSLACGLGGAGGPKKWPGSVCNYPSSNPIYFYRTSPDYVFAFCKSGCNPRLGSKWKYCATSQTLISGHDNCPSGWVDCCA